LQEGHEQGRVVGRKEGRIDERKHLLELLDQGLSIDEIKKRISQNIN